MKLLIEQYGRTLITISICFFFFFAISKLFEKAGEILIVDNQQIVIDERLEEMLPLLSIESFPIEINCEFNFRNHIEYALDYLGNDISENVYFEGDLDTSVAGGYDCKFHVIDSNGLKATVKCSLVVE